MTSERAPGGYRGAFVAYNAALAATSPMLLGWYGWRVLGSGKSREGWLERLGFPAGSQKGIVPRSNIWMHAVSVGEVTAAAPVVREYQQLPEPYGVEMSTITSTGRQMADRLLPEVPKLFLPVDLLPDTAERAALIRLHQIISASHEAASYAVLRERLRGLPEEGQIEKSAAELLGLPFDEAEAETEFRDTLEKLEQGGQKRAFAALQTKAQRLGVAGLTPEEKQMYLQVLNASGKRG